MKRASDMAGDSSKVAILGGGCGGLAAAWTLTATPALRARFDITVYEVGWQLGGKGASGRASFTPGDGLAAKRIEEHGLHIWFGFYEHAFRMMRSVYEEAGLAAGEDWWTVPFEKCDSVCLYDRREDGTWSRQLINLPRRGGSQRGPPTRITRRPLGRVIARTTRLLATGLREELAFPRATRSATAIESAQLGAVGDATSILDQIASEIDRAEYPAALDGADQARLSTRGPGQSPSAGVGGMRRATLEPLIDRLLGSVRDLQSDLQRREVSDRVRLWRGVLELMAAALAGVIRDDVLWRGFSSLDQEDLREWLARHGASQETLTRSPVLRGLYDLTFAYRRGDKRQPSLAAGRGLQALLMMVNYEGSFMWRMRAGMGDVVFAPWYLALKRRGVNFEFFSRVTGLRLAPGQPMIDAIELSRTATVTAGPDGYEPLERLDGWWCWPASPYADQLSDFSPHTHRLTRGTDFDDVVLAIPLGALSEICGDLAEGSRRFKQMLRGGETVRTKAFQVWLTRPIQELRPPDNEHLDPPATAYAEPFDTYCDMSHLLAVEHHEADDGPKGIAYFCAVLPDSTPETEAASSVRAGAARFLEREAAAIWPRAFDHGAFEWNLMFDPLGREGAERLDAQYFRANVAGTDRYVTTPAGSVDSRLAPGDSGFENLALAGDWTRTGIDGGCVEAAVIAGERAADFIIQRRGRPRTPAPQRRYVEYGALATAPGPLLCEAARLYCFFVETDRARVQRLCDRVLKAPTGGALRYRVPRFPPVILTFGTIAGLRSLHPDHADRGTASEPEAALWVPTVAQRFENGSYVDDHLAIFMPYIWVDDPIAFASGREVYGFAKTQGWMRRLDDPRGTSGSVSRDRTPDPPEELALDVYGVPEFGPASEMHRRRLITIRRRGQRRSGERSGEAGTETEGVEMASLINHFMSEFDPSRADGPDLAGRRSVRSLSHPVAGARAQARVMSELLVEQAVRHVFLKQIRDATSGELAALQQVIEARSSVVGRSLRWRRLSGQYELHVESLASHPLEDELGLPSDQVIRRAFAAEFGFRMEPGVVAWP